MYAGVSCDSSIHSLRSVEYVRRVPCGLDEGVVYDDVDSGWVGVAGGSSDARTASSKVLATLSANLSMSSLFGSLDMGHLKITR